MILWGAVLVLATLVAYVPAMRGEFIWDDEQYVARSLAVRSPDGLSRIWLHPWSIPQYYPLTLTSFWVEYRLWGSRPTGYHVTNVLLHSMNALLLWAILRRLGVPGAWLAAAIFSLHPVHVESVAWITERKNVLSGLFYFLSLGAYLRFAPPDEERRDARFYALSLVLFACALLAKSVTSTLPAAVLLLVFWKRGRITGRDFLPLVPFFALGATMGGITAWLEKHRVGAWGPEWDLSLLERCLVAGRAIWFYAGKLLWPARLTFIYPRWDVNPAMWWWYLFPAGVALAVAGLWVLRRRIGRGPLVAVLFFLGSLFPALSFVDVFPMLFSFVADHFQYLASTGLIVLGAASLTRACGPMLSRSSTGRVAGRLLGTALLAILATLTWRQGWIYADSRSLWADTQQKNPSAWMAHNNLGSLFYEASARAASHEERRRLVDEAGREFRAALEAKPDHLEARLNLARLSAERGDFGAATAHYEAAASLPNRYPPGSRGRLHGAEPHAQYARFLAAQGTIEPAIDQYREALAFDPGHEAARVGLGDLLAGAGRLEEARLQYLEALRTNPNSVPALNNLGSLLAANGALDEAIAHWNHVLRVDPDSPEAHNNLGSALVLRGNIEEAIRYFQRAIELRPEFAMARSNLADALGKQGKTVSRGKMDEKEKAE